MSRLMRAMFPAIPSDAGHSAALTLPGPDVSRVPRPPVTVPAVNVQEVVKVMDVALRDYAANK